jgi:hypothetical protein
VSDKETDVLALQIERRIYLIRGQKVMLDSDLRSFTGLKRAY